MTRSAVAFVVAIVALRALQAQGPEPAGWYAGDMHAHRSCGGAPVSESSIYQKMSSQNLATLSLLADMGNGEVQNAATDLPLVNGKDDPISTSGRIMHWDAEWHWDANYSQYPHQALGGHIVALGLSRANQIWDESTDPIFQWAHAQNAVAGFAHMQYLGTGIPTALSCCTPFEYPIEIALGSADFISEDVNGGDTALQAYYELLDSGFRPGFAAGTDYPCNDGTTVGNPLTYVRVMNGEMSYRNWIDGIAAGRTVVSRNGHKEFLDLKVNGSAAPGDEINLSSEGAVSVTVTWTATQNLSGTIELLSNGSIVASKQAAVSSGSSAALTASIAFPKSGWIAARRMDPVNGHMLQTGAIYIIVNNKPIRANATDPQFYAQWITYLLGQISAGGAWNYFFPTELAATQQRYQQAKALYQQIANEAVGTGPSLSSITVTPANSTTTTGSTQQFIATGKYSDGSSLNITGQVAWASSNSYAATINSRGLASAITPGSATISASQGGVSGGTSFTVQSSPLSIATQTLPSGTAGASYSTTLAANGGITPYTWSIAGGSLPAGLSLNASSGSISGTPTVAGAFSFTVQVSDYGNPAQVATRNLIITIASLAGNCPCSIWPVTAIPTIADGGPDSPVELGVQFQSDLNGSISGIRFYKSAGNTGTHIGNLWNSTGTRLATATFTGESASGWQQVNFASPVAITAGTIYIASYHTVSGHYAYDQYYFASHGVDNSPLHAPQDSLSSHNGLFVYGAGGFPNQTWTSTNYWVDIVFTPTGIDTTPPGVQSVTPAANTSGVDPKSPVTATFNEAINPATINGTSMELLDPSSSPVAATVSYVSANNTATLTPNTALLDSTTYTVLLKGGTIRDVAGNAMVSNYTWSFTTAAPQPPPPTDGPGGPILIVSSSTNPFSRYYTEILRTEGLNEFAAIDISQVSAETLSNYDIVILGNFPLTAAQAGMFTTWVNGGGNLIAMRPDKQLAGLLGLTNTEMLLSDAYLMIDTNAGPGTGLINQAIQFHGNADRYTVNGATTIATLYSTSTTSTTNPAVTIKQAGFGQAAAFAFDLARSVVYTRQGNPAWSGEARDGQEGPIRPDDLFFGNASFDPQPDYVDHNKLAIPQADEQQRLLANLVIQMNLAKQPLPRFWYFPQNFTAAVVLTGDDHGSMYEGGATASRFDHYLSLSPTGCSVANWKCVRSTSYLIAPSLASTSLTNTQAASYVSQGFEIGVHVDSVPDCSDWTASGLAAFYSSQINSFESMFPGVPQPSTHRMHCISWSDYDAQPRTELANGIRLDTNYYYWPPAWVNDTPGMFTGSGMPMRFASRDGTMLDIYQATTQMTDESGQSYPLHIDSLLNNAVGAPGYYGFFTANMHNDTAASSEADLIIASAQSRGVPVISAAQLLTWLDGRNGSSFTSLAWNGSILTFEIAIGVGANGIQAMLPAHVGSSSLNSISLDGSNVGFTLKAIKGILYGVFPAAPGNYQAIYTTGSTIRISSLSMAPSSVMGGSSSTGTVSLNGPAPTGGALVKLTTSDASDTTLAASVTVPQGATAATFTVNTTSVSTATTVVISATYAGDSVFSNLSITPTLTLAGVTLNPISVLGGGSATGTVTLSAAAPAGGIVVNLTSNNASVAAVPTSVAVAAGASTAIFAVTTYPVNEVVSVSITGTYGATHSATLTVKPPTPSSVALNPASVPVGNTSVGTVTLNGPASPSGAVVSLSSSNTAVATVPASVLIQPGVTSATFTVSTLSTGTSMIAATYAGGSANGQVTVIATIVFSNFTLAPASLIGGSTSTGTVTLAQAAPAGGFVVTLSSANPSVASVPANVTIGAGSTFASFTITTTPVAVNTAVVITATASGSSKNATVTVNPPALSSLTRSPSSVTGGNTATGTVTLTGKAPSGGLTVTLSSAIPSAASVPVSVTVASGNTAATFTISTTPVALRTAVIMTASLASIIKQATITVIPPALSSLALNPTTVSGGTPSTGTVTLTGPAPTGGVVITLASSNPATARVPGTVTVAAGTASAKFTITTYAVGTRTTSTISASVGSVKRTSRLTVTAPTS